MALFIRRKSDMAVFADKTHLYQGGVVCAFEVSGGVYCPMVVYHDAISISDDSLNVRTPKAVNKEFLVFSDDTVIDPAPDEFVFGFWNVEGKKFHLVSKKTGDTRFFLQTDASRSFYLPRGNNFIESQSTFIGRIELLPDLNVDLSQLDNDPITGKDGFLPSSDVNRNYPLSWNLTWWADNGYFMNTSNEWTKTAVDTCSDPIWVDTGNTRCKDNVSQKEQRSSCPTTPKRWTNDPNGTACNITDDLIPFTLTQEDMKNRINIMQFPDLELDKIHPSLLNVMGYGFPTWSNEPVDDNGRLLMFKKGITHCFNLIFPNRKIVEYYDGDTKLRDVDRNKPIPPHYTESNDHYYYFQQVSHLVSRSADGINDEPLVNPLKNSGKKFNQLSERPDLIQRLGRGMITSPKNVETGNWDTPAKEGYLMLDEEDNSEHYVKGNGMLYTLINNLSEGISNILPKYKQMWYGNPLTWWFHTNGNSHVVDDSTIITMLDGHCTTFGIDGLRYVDVSLLGYFRIPSIVNHEIYEKEANGAYKIVGGKRVYLKEEFTETIFGRNFQILPVPHDNIRYQAYNALNNPSYPSKIFGVDSFEIGSDGTAYMKEPYLSAGFQFQDERHNALYWKPETQLYVTERYAYANWIMACMLLMTKAEFNSFDISKFRIDAKFLGDAVRRPQVEPYTMGGNSIEYRETGRESILFETMFAYLSGIRSVSSWDNGRYKNSLSEIGQPVFGYDGDTPNSVDVDDNYSRYTVKLAAVHSIFQPLKDTNVADWTYIHFYFPIKSEKNYEVISSGIYVGTTFVVMFYNPTLGNGETQNILLTCGGSTFNLVIDSRKVLFKKLTIPQGLVNTDFTLEYTNIYQKFIKVKGKVINNIQDHYIAGGE